MHDSIICPYEDCNCDNFGVKAIYLDSFIKLTKCRKCNRYFTFKWAVSQIFPNGWECSVIVTMKKFVDEWFDIALKQIEAQVELISELRKIVREEI